MTEFTEILLHARRLKKAVAELSFDELTEARDKLAKVIADREEDEKARVEAEAEKLKQIEEIQRLMSEAGVSAEELTGAGAAKSKGPKRKVEPKYCIIVNGEEHTWTGRGRKPVVFEQALAAGKSLEDYLIQK